jgi:hypothetical protein
MTKRLFLTAFAMLTLFGCGNAEVQDEPPAVPEPVHSIPHDIHHIPPPSS